MCLLRVEKPQEESGYGWKVVRETELEGVYKSLFDYYGYLGGSRYEDFGSVKGTAIYKDGVTYRVGHKRQAEAASGEKYPAGVHLYASFSEAQHNKLKEPGRIIKKFKYDEAVARDDTVIVAMEATPLKGENDEAQ